MVLKIDIMDSLTLVRNFVILGLNLAKDFLVVYINEILYKSVLEFSQM